MLNDAILDTQNPIDYLHQLMPVYAAVHGLLWLDPVLQIIFIFSNLQRKLFDLSQNYMYKPSRKFNK